MFDCVIPTRAGRHGQAYTWQGRRNLKNARYTSDPLPLEEGCVCDACAHFSRGYLRHLVKADEMLGKRLLTLHNVFFYQSLMRRLRQAIRAGEDLSALREEASRATSPA